MAISCKKIQPDLISTNENPQSKASSNEENNNQGKSTATFKVDLVKEFIFNYNTNTWVWTGNYLATYKEFFVVVSGIVNTIPVIRNGDPAYGIIGTYGVPEQNESVDILPTAPGNHFALSRVDFGSYSSINYAGYFEALNNYISGSNSIRPNIATYISNGSQISNRKIFTGKLIRSTTGTSTYALATENYPVPPAYVPNPPVSSSDECSNAINIEFGSIGVNSTTINATPSTSPPVPSISCNPNGINDDVWFKFTTINAIANYAINISHVETGEPMTMTAYSGLCSSLTQIGCNSTGSLYIPGANLSPNTTYYLRVYTASSNPTDETNFRISVSHD
jgi:hypothetical protein